MFIENFLPKIKIHCWGGLGSQLYAVALRLELQAIYPSRKFMIICHESGVTKRVAEISHFFPDSVLSVHDYRDSKKLGMDSQVPKYYKFKNRLRRVIIRILRKVSVVVDGDRVPELAQIRLWTVQIRGHYSERKLDKNALTNLRFLLERSSKIQVIRGESEDIFVHYRLGDLLTLVEKSPVDAERIIHVIKGLHNRHGSSIKLFSDSPDRAIELLAPGKFDVKVNHNLNSLDTLLALIHSKYFVGTNSKISVWAAVLSFGLGSRVEIFLPYEIQHHVIANLGSSGNITYY